MKPLPLYPTTGGPRGTRELAPCRGALQVHLSLLEWQRNRAAVRAAERAKRMPVAAFALLLAFALPVAAKPATAQPALTITVEIMPRGVYVTDNAPTSDFTIATPDPTHCTVRIGAYADRDAQVRAFALCADRLQPQPDQVRTPSLSNPVIEPLPLCACAACTPRDCTPRDVLDVSLITHRDGTRDALVTLWDR